MAGTSRGREQRMRDFFAAEERRHRKAVDSAMREAAEKRDALLDSLAQAGHNQRAALASTMGKSRDQYLQQVAEKEAHDLRTTYRKIFRKVIKWPATPGKEAVVSEVSSLLAAFPERHRRSIVEIIVLTQHSSKGAAGIQIARNLANLPADLRRLIFEELPEDTKPLVRTAVRHWYALLEDEFLSADNVNAAAANAKARARGVRSRK